MKTCQTPMATPFDFSGCRQAGIIYQQDTNFTSKDKWPLDQPGVWTYTVNATWNDFKGRFQDFRIRVGTSSFWITTTQAGQG